MNTNVRLALFFTLAIVLWFGSGSFGTTDSGEPVATKESSVYTKVQATNSIQQSFSPTVQLRAKTKVNREVKVLAEVSGKVTSALVEEGAGVIAGQGICEIGAEDRFLSLAQAKALWKLREDISETLWHWQPYKNDISVRVSRMPDFLREVDELVAGRYPDFEVIWYGHIGDGNLHLNILRPETLSNEEFVAKCGTVSAEIGQLLAKYEGSISAEHGVGLLKKDYLHYSRSPLEIKLMREIKKVFDPNLILNPGKLFD